MCKVTLKQPPQLRTWHHWLHGPEVQGVYRQPTTTPQKNTPKRAGQNFESNSCGAIIHKILVRTSSIYQAFEKLLWKPSENAYQKSSIGITPNIIRSSDSFSTGPLIVNGGPLIVKCIVRDLETIIVLVWLAFNFIPRRSHHSVTLWLQPRFELIVLLLLR